MDKFSITPGPDPFDRILTGEFHSLSDFKCNRPGGTADWLIIQTIGGGGTLMADGKSHLLLPGDIVLSRPASAHHYQTSLRCGKWDLLWAHFHPRHEWVNWLHWPKLGGGWGRLHFSGASERKLQHRLRQMHHYASRPQGRGRHDLLAIARRHRSTCPDAVHATQRPAFERPPLYRRSSSPHPRGRGKAFKVHGRTSTKSATGISPKRS